MRTTPALVFGLAALPGAWWLWHAPPSEPVAAAVLVLVATALGAWLGPPKRPVEGAMHGVGVTLAATLAARFSLLVLQQPTTYALDRWTERLGALSVAAGITLALAVAAGVALGVIGRRRGYENQPDTTSTS